MFELLTSIEFGVKTHQVVLTVDNSRQIKQCDVTKESNYVQIVSEMSAILIFERSKEGVININDRVIVTFMLHIGAWVTNDDTPLANEILSF